MGGGRLTGVDVNFKLYPHADYFLTFKSLKFPARDAQIFFADDSDDSDDSGQRCNKYYCMHTLATQQFAYSPNPLSHFSKITSPEAIWDDLHPTATLLVVYCHNLQHLTGFITSNFRKR